jgi:hypothetical protein
MSHVSTTAHYHLPIYGGSDIINPLTDVNGTNEALDTAIYEVAQELASGVTDIADVKNKVGDASLDTASQNLSGAVNELKSAIDTQGDDITDVEANVGTLQSQMATATSNITTLNTTVAGLQTEVSGKASQTAVNTLATKVGTNALITTADNLSDAVNELKGDIDGITPKTTPDVTVTGNGAKTLGTILNELGALVDYTKINKNTLVLEKYTNGTSRTGHICQWYNPSGGSDLPYFIFAFSNVNKGQDNSVWFQNRGIKVSSANSFAVVSSTGSTTTAVTVQDETSSVVGNGDSFEIYY